MSTRTRTPSQHRRSIRKVFTLREANRALPYVSRVVADLTARHEQARQVHAQIDPRQRGRSRELLEQRLNELLDDIQRLVEELGDVGCAVRDFKQGIIEFVGRHQGREIILCWRLGDEQIRHWYEAHADLEGKLPVSILRET